MIHLWSEATFQKKKEKRIQSFKQNSVLSLVEPCRSHKRKKVLILCLKSIHTVSLQYLANWIESDLIGLQQPQMLSEFTSETMHGALHAGNTA